MTLGLIKATGCFQRDMTTVDNGENQMSDRPDNPSAFPVPLEDYRDINHPLPGMDLRDYFAAAFLSGVAANPEASYEPADLANWAYRNADTMLAERAK